MRKSNEKSANKLALRREPLRRLTSAELSRVRGAESGSVFVDTTIVPGHDSTTMISCNCPPTLPHESIRSFPSASFPVG